MRSCIYVYVYSALYIMHSILFMYATGCICVWRHTLPEESVHWKSTNLTILLTEKIVKFKFRYLSHIFKPINESWYEWTDWARYKNLTPWISCRVCLCILYYIYGYCICIIHIYLMYLYTAYEGCIIQSVHMYCKCTRYIFMYTVHL